MHVDDVWIALGGAMGLNDQIAECQRLWALAGGEGDAFVLEGLLAAWRAGIGKRQGYASPDEVEIFALGQSPEDAIRALRAELLQRVVA